MQCFGVVVQDYCVVGFYVQCGGVGSDVGMCFVDYCYYVQWDMYVFDCQVVWLVFVLCDLVDYVWQVGYFVYGVSDGCNMCCIQFQVV